MMTVGQFEQALLSLKDYWGVVGVFGGNPALHPKFGELCYLMRKHVPYEQRGLWCNNPFGWGKEMAKTFNPAVSNLNVHMDRKAYEEFKRDWPACGPVGLAKDSRHSPVYVAMKDVLRKECPSCDGIGGFVGGATGDTCTICNGTGQVYDEERAWELISGCDINQHWSAMIGVFRGELRTWFCEVAGAQAMLHQHEPGYPDTGIPLPEQGMIADLQTGTRLERWWQWPMELYRHQVRKHCHECGVPLRGYGELAQAGPEGSEQVSATHQGVFKTKRSGRKVELVTVESQLQRGKLGMVTKYLQNADK